VFEGKPDGDAKVVGGGEEVEEATRLGAEKRLLAVEQVRKEAKEQARR
jgi:hypothetical protein